MISLTKVKKTPNMGFGLYATKDIKHHRLKKDRTVVVEFEDGARMTAKQWEKYHTKMKIPFDAGIHFFSYVIYDKAFDNPKSPPKWYRLNHSSTPNVELTKKGNTIQWKTLRGIRKGEQLLFHYGNPDPSWM